MMDEHYAFFLKNSARRWNAVKCLHDGLFWTVNPQDYESIISNWIPNTELDQTEKYHVIARGAFGVLYVWGEKGGHCLNISSYAGRYYSFANPFTGEKLGLGAQVFFSSLNPAYNVSVRPS
ncbi:GAD-like domain-containing protein, partial [Pseudomonas syringae]|uniref:GAD-like domain-containing protein n=1 Tax=Pseudomonas syringae TaxID=317 RepID=UPI0023514659